MKKVLFLSLSLFVFSLSFAQNPSLKAIVTKEFRAYNQILLKFDTFHEGDEVTIHAYKKKNGLYNFVISTDDFANQLLNAESIPFDVQEKQLKKLPNALSDDMRLLVKQIESDIIKRKKFETKSDALSGIIKVVVRKDEELVSTERGNDSHLKLKEGDTICVIGYTKEYSNHLFAIYNKQVAGIYKSLNNPYESDIPIRFLPSVNDSEVLSTIKRETKNISLRYRENVLKGNIKAVITDKHLSRNPIVANSNIIDGDTVTIVGYSKNNGISSFAVYNDKGAGIFTSRSQWTNIDDVLKNTDEIRFELMPSVDDMEVIAIIERQKQVVDSLQRIEHAKYIDNYRKAHHWAWIPINGANLHCSLCDYSVYLEDSIVCLAYINDTLYHFTNKTFAMEEEYMVIHKLPVPNSLKSNSIFKNHIEAFSDSLCSSKHSDLSYKAEIINSIEFLNAADNVKKIAPFGYFEEWGWSADYGSVAFHCKYTNTNQQTIKYIDIYWTITNDVDDVRGTGHFKGTGPLAEWETGSWGWDYSGYYVAGDATNMQITKVILTFMNGSQKTLTKSTLCFN